MDKVNLNEKFSLFNEHWTPKIVGELNDQMVMLAKVKGEFVWHRHVEQDELFLVVKGAITIRMRDREVHLKEGEFFIVPRNTEHQPFAEEEAHLLLFEPKTTRHTGEEKFDVTVENPEWL